MGFAVLKDQLLRLNLDVMHIEKNVFNNIVHTVLNVAKRTKDNLKSRKDLPAICRWKDLELLSDGKAPVPIFRLSKEGRGIFLKWMKNEIKFPDGYVSNISSCVYIDNAELIGLKSHCHVIMQRLLAIAFAKHLTKVIPHAFRDMDVKVDKPAL